MQPRAPQGLEGVWKKCYEPGLEDVDEIDTGYLVLGPGGRYTELSWGCCDTPPSWQSGPYRAEGETVTFGWRRHDGTAYESTLTLRRGAAVFFDDLKSEPRRVEALTASGDLNYAWCRVYPEVP
jgi:hypothetical protein